MWGVLIEMWVFILIVKKKTHCWGKAVLTLALNLGYTISGGYFQIAGGESHLSDTRYSKCMSPAVATLLM